MSRLTSPRRAFLFVAAFMGFVMLNGSAGAATFEELYQQGLRARDAGNFSAAERLFGDALSLQPENADAILLLGLVQAYDKKYDESLSTLTKGLKLEPDNMDLLIAVARVKSWGGRLEEAETDVDALLRLYPGNLEARILKGRLALFDGRHREAELIFRPLLEKMPNNITLLIGLGDALRGQGQTDEARLYFERALALEPNSSEVQGRLRAEEPPAFAWQLNAGYVRSRFGRRPVKDWHEGYAQLVRRFGNNMIVDARYQRSRRHGLVDENLQLGGAYRFSRNGGAHLRVEITPTADFLPRWGVAAGGDVRLLDGTEWIGPLSATLDLRHRHYPTVDVSNTDPGVVLYLLEGRVWITGRRITAYDDSVGKWLDGWLAKIDIQAHDRVRVYTGRAKSPETDLGNTVDVFTTIAGVIFDVTPNLAVRVDFAHDSRQQSYTRRELSLGLSVRF